MGLLVNGPLGYPLAGGGAVILTATNNSFTGGTLISAGTLQVGNGSLTGSLPGSVVNNGVLALDPSATQPLTLAGIVSGGGNLVMLGNGVATLTASSTYSGQTRSRPARCSSATGPRSRPPAQSPTTARWPSPTAAR